MSSLEYHTVADVANILHYSRNSVYGLIKSGKLRAVRISSHEYRISDDDLRDFIEKNRVIS